MDYEKKYKEALELARVAAFNGHQSLMEGIFPELKESEDEKIRKELITHCRNTRCVTKEGAERIAKWLAWLENIPYTIDHEKREGFHLGYKAGLEKQGEQELTWSEEDEKEYKYVLKFIDNILNNCDNDKDYDCSKRCYDWLKSIKQKIERE